LTLSIVLPKFLSATNCAKTIAICQQIAAAEEGVVELDARGVAFVDPFALTLLGASMHALKGWGQRVRIHGLDSDAGGYLHRMDLFKDVELVDCAPPPQRRHDRRDSLLELTQIDDRDLAADAARRMAQALVGVKSAGWGVLDAASREDRLVQVIQYLLTELLENAVTHAQRDGFRGKARVWLAAQHYRSNDRVRLAVTDTGCGLLATLRDHPALTAQTHFAAIQAAMKPRVSCNRDLGVLGDSVNQGVGLTTVVRIAGLAGGRATVVSGDAFQVSGRAGGRLAGGAFWQGVAVSLEVQRNRVMGVRIADALPLADVAAAVSPRFEP
jgi:hypothetical protein